MNSRDFNLITHEFMYTY